MGERMNIFPKGNIFPIDVRGFCTYSALWLMYSTPSPQKNSPFPLFFSLRTKIKKKTPQFVSPQLILCFWQSLIWFALRERIFVVLGTMMRIFVGFWWHDILLLSTSKLLLSSSHFWLYTFSNGQLNCSQYRSGVSSYTSLQLNAVSNILCRVISWNSALSLLGPKACSKIDIFQAATRKRQ